MRGRLGTEDYTESSFRGGHIGIYVSESSLLDCPWGDDDVPDFVDSCRTAGGTPGPRRPRPAGATRDRPVDLQPRRFAVPVPAQWQLVRRQRCARAPAAQVRLPAEEGHGRQRRAVHRARGQPEQHERQALSHPMSRAA
ncbi:hypothetical protein G6F31_018788 [Rhizopus arrhizus]|nr:hypothetical protein G6F31_018788 [Rhizopus arrhizus]